MSTTTTAAPTASDLKDRIADLEKELEDQHTNAASAKDAVAFAFAHGSDPTAVLEALHQEESIVAGMVGALAMLDAQWFETASAEFRAGVKAINDETDKAYGEAKGALESAITANLSPILKKYGVDNADLLGDFKDGVLQGAWEILSARGADKLRALGTAPNTPFERDEMGHPAKPAIMQGAY